MTLEKQNEFLLSLVNLLLVDLGAHLAFFDWTNELAKGMNVAGILNQCRQDSVVEPQVADYLQWLAVLLAESPQSDPAQAYREFLRRWTDLGKAD